MNSPHDQLPRPPLFFLIFISMFGFIGVAVLIFLWTAKGFGAPPLIFKVFGSFIALGFIAMGFGLPLTILAKVRRSRNDIRLDSAQVSKPPSGGYDCPNCGGNVGSIELSPSGDVKCGYCGDWWNLHKK